MIEAAAFFPLKRPVYSDEPAFFQFVQQFSGLATFGQSGQFDDFSPCQPFCFCCHSLHDGNMRSDLAKQGTEKDCQIPFGAGHFGEADMFDVLHGAPFP